MDEADKLIKARYDELCAKRDAVNKQLAPLKERRESNNVKILDLQKDNDQINAQIESLRGGQSWIDLKRHIGKLANALSGRLKAAPQEE